MFYLIFDPDFLLHVLEFIKPQFLKSKIMRQVLKLHFKLLIKTATLYFCFLILNLLKLAKCLLKDGFQKFGN